MTENYWTEVVSPALDADAVTYKIVRFFQDDRPKEIVRTGLTLAQAKEHCAQPYTQGEGWFDGFTQEGTSDHLGFAADGDESNYRNQEES